MPPRKSVYISVGYGEVVRQRPHKSSLISALSGLFWGKSQRGICTCGLELFKTTSRLRKSKDTLLLSPIQRKLWKRAQCFRSEMQWLAAFQNRG
jgi:hypothetical protein